MFDENYRLVIEFPDAPKLQADTMTPMARTSYRKRWAHRVCGEVMAQRGRPSEPLEGVIIHGTRWSSRMPDRGSLAYSFKPILDALEPAKGRLPRCEVITSDWPRVVIGERYEWIYEAKQKGRVRLEVLGVSKEFADHHREDRRVFVGVVGITRGSREVRAMCNGTCINRYGRWCSRCWVEILRGGWQQDDDEEVWEADLMYDDFSEMDV